MRMGKNLMQIYGANGSILNAYQQLLHSLDREPSFGTKSKRRFRGKCARRSLVDWEVDDGLTTEISQGTQ